MRLIASEIENIELEHNKTNKMTCASSEDLDQPGHRASLIGVFAVHLMDSC